MTEYIKRTDAIHAALHYEGAAAVAAIQGLKAFNPHDIMREMLIDGMIDKARCEWVSVKERMPEPDRMVLTAIYTTDLIWQKDGETIEEAAARVQAEAAARPRREIGAWNEEDGWYECVFGAPMVCQPEYWLEIPDAPRKEQTDA